MKTKLTFEEWMGTIKVPYMQNPKVKLYENPTPKEILQLTKEDYGVYRAFLLPNGKMIAWAQTIHNEIYKQVPETKGGIPVTIKPTGTKADIKMTDFLNKAVPNWNKDDIVKRVKNHKRLKYMYQNMTVGFYDEM